MRLNFMATSIVLILFLVTASGDRQIFKFDFDWKFLLFNTSNLPTCPANTFPINMNGKQCFGLSSSAATNAADCAKECCSDNQCETWQWCPSDATHCSPKGTCWIGAMKGCQNSDDWQGGGRTVGPSNSTKCDTIYCNPSYDDSTWRSLNIPHDFVVEGNFTPNGDVGHGSLPKGVGWYRKHFKVPDDFKGQRVWLYFDGVYRDSDVYLNGYKLGNHPSGYTSFYYFIDQYLNFGGQDNLIAVRANALQNEGWWYEGGGIYRHIWLYVSAPVRIVPWGVYAPSQVTGTINHSTDAPTATSARVQVEITVANDYAESRVVTIKSEIYNAAGTPVGKASVPNYSVKPSNATVEMTINLNNVFLWDVTNPYLYRLVSSVVATDGTILDHLTTDIGIRVVVFDKDVGLILNEKRVKVKGLCNHQDFAGVGTAVPDRINLFRVQKLKEMGANAWRMSHNPPNSELLDFTDRNGFLVWDENRNFGDSEQYYSDVALLPLRDRNHPSIVIWSLCNEGGCMEGANDTAALNVAIKMKNIILSIDKTRPISGAWNSDYNDLINGWGPKVMDIQGVNYNYGELDPYHKLYPNKPMISSETSSCTGARGVYITDDSTAHKSILTANGCVVQWWTADATRDFVAGGFSWTGFDYKGEPTPYGWPEVNSNFGTIDLAGFPKDTFWYYQAWWTSQPVLHVFPPWKAIEGPIGVSTVTCNSNDARQQFKYGGSSSVAAPIISADGSMCVDATCADVSTGCVPLKLKTCNNNDNNQKFYHMADGSFKNVANGGCADLWDSGTGPEVGVYECDGGENQHWQVNGNQIKSDTSGNKCFTIAPPQSVWAYTNAASGELFVNGVSQGKQTVPALGNLMWGVDYTDGSIEVKSYDTNGKQIDTVTLKTPGAPNAILLEIEIGKNGIDADRQDVAMLIATVVDSTGAIVPDASNVINFSVSGPGSILGVGNGDPSCHEHDKANWRSAFNGLARVIIQASNQPGSIQVTASSPGLQSGKATVQTVIPAKVIPSI